MRSQAKKLILVFTFAYLLNFVWENLHSLLYISYQNGPITGFILARATLFDALFITTAGLLTIVLSKFKYRFHLAILLLFLLSIGIEMWAVQTSRWVYGELMPLVPILKVGLTPTVQLALLGFLSFYLARLLPQESTTSLGK